MSIGVPIGYSSPHTLTDTSLKIIPGQPGDLSILRPTVIIAVPLVVDRLYKGIQLKIRARGETFEKFFNACIAYKTSWKNRGFNTPLCDRLLFSKTRAVLGGRVRAVFMGGAPVSRDVQEYLRTVLCAKMIQGYGLTECCGGITCGDANDFSLAEVGVVIQDSLVKLENWDEGNYRVDDKVGPRGEIVISGGAVSRGYYKCESAVDNAAFYRDAATGVQWFRTGDIGHVNPSTGTLKIVDRRKDLVKLQMGEYVSLSKVEAALKVHPLVDTVCVYADPQRTATVALIIPADGKLLEFRDQLCLPNTLSREDLCTNETLVDVILKSVTNFVQNKLERFEIPQQVKLVPPTDPWTPDNGLLTTAMKLKRKPIQQKYQKDIDAMYRKIA